MASLHEHNDDDKPGREYDDEQLANVFADERTTDAPQDEDEEHRRIRRIKNAKRAKRRWNAEARTQTHLSAETSTVPSLQPTIASTTRQLGTSLKQLC
jgi:hypothetical protein